MAAKDALLPLAVNPLVAVLLRQQRWHHARGTALPREQAVMHALRPTGFSTPAGFASTGVHYRQEWSDGRYPPLQIDYERFGVYQIGEV